MSDRIADLRTLRKLERAAHDGGELLSWANAADILRGALYDDCDALLDCAEALQAVLATLEWQAHGECRSADGPILSSADAVAMGKAALAALTDGEEG